MVGNKGHHFRIIILLLITFIVLYSNLFGYQEYPISLNQPSRINMCLATMNTDFSNLHQEINEITMKSELKSKMESLSAIDSSTYSLFINKAFALQFGYPYYISNATNYNQPLYPLRHSSWLKLDFILDLLQTQNCDWLAYIDSKSYFYTRQHQLSLETLFSILSVHDSSSNYNEFEYYKRLNNGRFPIENHSDHFKIGLLGLSHKNKLGYPQATQSLMNDFASTSVFFVRNSEQGRQIITDWINGTNEMTEDEVEVYQQFSKRYGREQSVLNKVIIPYHHNSISFYSYLDFGDASSIATRTVNVKSERVRAMKMEQVLMEIWDRQ